MLSERIIYGIGGGDSRDERMQLHHSRITNLAKAHSGNESPKVTLLPTAHRNGLHPKFQSREFIAEAFMSKGCKVSEILIGDVKNTEKETDANEIEEILKESDAVFVLGGDTRYMLNTLAEKKLIPTFRNSYESGVIFSGSSAGLVWLANSAMSDSESTTNPNHWSFIMLKGMGILPIIVNVHDNSGIPEGVLPVLSRKESFEEKLKAKSPSLGIAVDEFVALEVRNGLCKIISPSEDIGAYLVANIDGAITRRKIEDTVDLFDAVSLVSYLKGPKTILKI